MFWKFGFAALSAIDSILDKEQFNLIDLLKEEDLLQEVKTHNKRLLDYLSRKDVLQELIDYTTIEPDEELDEGVRYKFPNVSSEVLSSEVWPLIDGISNSHELLDQLWGFLDSGERLNPLMGSFFSKVAGVLISKRPTQNLEYLKAKGGVIESILNHVATPAVVDLLPRMVAIQERKDAEFAANWLHEEHLVRRLIEKFDPSNDDYVHTNAAQALIEMVTVCNEQMGLDPPFKSPLVDDFESAENLSLLFDHIFKGCESSIVNGLAYFLALADNRIPAPPVEPGSNAPPPVNLPVHCIDRSKVFAAVIPRLKDLHNLLQHDIGPSKVVLTSGTMAPFGQARLKVAKLISVLVRANDPDVNNELARLGTMKLLLDLFFKYRLNNFLHSVVTDTFKLILSNPPHPDGTHPLFVTLFKDCELPRRIVEASDDEPREATDKIRKRSGYMGHLMLLANAVVAASTSENAIVCAAEVSPHITDSKWRDFVSGQLTETNAINTMTIGGIKPSAAAESSDDEDIFSGTGTENESAAELAFARYMSQHITNDFPDDFGFDDDDDHDDDDSRNFGRDHEFDARGAFRTEMRNELRQHMSAFETGHEPTIPDSTLGQGEWREHTIVDAASGSRPFGGSAPGSFAMQFNSARQDAQSPSKSGSWDPFGSSTNAVDSDDTSDSSDDDGIVAPRRDDAAPASNEQWGDFGEFKSGVTASSDDSTWADFSSSASKSLSLNNAPSPMDTNESDA
eukprot:Opistho-1_new@90347